MKQVNPGFIEPEESFQKELRKDIFRALKAELEACMAEIRPRMRKALDTVIQDTVKRIESTGKDTPGNDPGTLFDH